MVKTAVGGTQLAQAAVGGTQAAVRGTQLAQAAVRGTQLAQAAVDHGCHGGLSFLATVQNSLLFVVVVFRLLNIYS